MGLVKHLPLEDLFWKYGRSEALIACKIPIQVVGIICTPGKPHSDNCFVGTPKRDVRTCFDVFYESEEDVYLIQRVYLYIYILVYIYIYIFVDMYIYIHI